MQHASIRSVVCGRIASTAYLLHWRGGHPLRETVAAFEELRRDGKILAWGVSNFDADDLDELFAIDSESRPACNQVLYHLQERAIEHAVLPWCESHGVAVVAYSPFGHDRFPSPSSAGGRVLAEAARAHNVTPRQIALAFLTRRPSTFAISKASRPSHAEENAGVGSINTFRRRDRADRQGVSARPEAALATDDLSGESEGAHETCDASHDTLNPEGEKSGRN